MQKCVCFMQWIHAVGITPAVCMHPSNLALAQHHQTSSSGVTTTPYAFSNRYGMEEKPQAGKVAVNNVMEGQHWRWQGVGKVPDGSSLQQQGRAKRKRLAESTTAEAMDCKGLFVANVAYDASEDDLKALFGQHGTVVGIRVPKRGLAIINMSDVRETQLALDALHDSEFMGRKLMVDLRNNDRRNQSTATENNGHADGKQDTYKKRKQDNPYLNECCFCLSSKAADPNLVVSIGDNCYLAKDKGGLTEHHVLIVPIEHENCSLTVKPETHNEVRKYVNAVKDCFQAELGLSTLFFERHIQLRHHGGNHMHINAIPMTESAIEKASDVIRQIGDEHQITFEMFSSDDMKAGKLKQYIGCTEYVMFELSDGSALVHKVSPNIRHNLRFCREAVAQILGTPNKADWKNCTLSKSDESTAVETLKTLFEKYDIMA